MSDPAALPVRPAPPDRLIAAAPWILLAAVAFAMTPAVSDPDFWWHLASGRWMWEHESLLHSDPFGIPLHFGEPPLRSQFVLRQFWLAQLVYHWVDAAAGLGGIIVLRAAVLGAMFAVLFRRLRRRGAPDLLAAALLALAAWVIVFEIAYIGDRPQLWTSLFLVLLLELLDGAFAGSRVAQAGLPVLMLLWANLHGGFIVGVGIIGVYALGRIAALREDWRPFAAAVAAVAASALNPNGFDSALQVAATFSDAPFAAYWRSIVETQSIFDHATPGGIVRRLPALTALAIAAGAGLVAQLARPRSLALPLLLVGVVATVMGVRAIRFIPFFAVVAAELAALGLAPLLDRPRAWARARLPGRTGAWVGAAGVLALAAAFALPAVRTSAFVSGPLRDTRLDGAVQFMKSNRLTGRLFADHNDGGYLIDALGPPTQLFVDGRVLQVRVFELYRMVVDQPEGPSPIAPGISNWKAAFATAGVDLVLLPGADPVSGTLIRLVDVLLRDPDWEVVFADDRVILFVSRKGRLGDFAASHALPRTVGYDNMLRLALGAAGGGHARMMPNWMLSAAVAHAGRGELADALQLVMRYTALAPGDPFGQSLKGQLIRRYREPGGER